MSDYKGMFSPDDLRSLATGLENANSSAEHLSRLLYEAMKADKKKRTEDVRHEQAS